MTVEWRSDSDGPAVRIDGGEWMPYRSFGAGDLVVKDPAGWRPSEFDGWGAGRGVGVVIQASACGMLDVRWPGGRCYQWCWEVLAADRDCRTLPDPTTLLSVQ